MSREIKFRAWDKFNGQYWHSENYKNLGDFFTKMQHLINGGNNLIFEQYTGLEDKNGKEIYEGDVVEADWHWEKGRVVDLSYESNFFYAISEYCLEDVLEIIGNIHENPELIK